MQAVKDKRFVPVTAETKLKSVIEQKLILNKTRIIITHHYLMRFGPSCDENTGGINPLLLMKFSPAATLVPVGYRGGYVVQFEDVMQARNSLPERCSSWLSLLPRLKENKLSSRQSTETLRTVSTFL